MVSALKEAAKRGAAHDVQIELTGYWTWEQAQQWRDAGIQQVVYHRSRDAQAAGVAALQETAYADAVRTLIETQRPRLAAGLRTLGLRVVDGQANYLLFNAPADFGGKLRRRGAVVRSCVNYTGLDATWYRTAVRTEKENAALLKIMREVLV